MICSRKDKTFLYIKDLNKNIWTTFIDWCTNSSFPYLELNFNKDDPLAITIEINIERKQQKLVMRATKRRRKRLDLLCPVSRKC